MTCKSLLEKQSVGQPLSHQACHHAGGVIDQVRSMRKASPGGGAADAALCRLLPRIFAILAPLPCLPNARRVQAGSKKQFTFGLKLAISPAHVGNETEQ